VEILASIKRTIPPIYAQYFERRPIFVEILASIKRTLSPIYAQYFARSEVLCRSEHSTATSARVATRVIVMPGVLCACVLVYCPVPLRDARRYLGVEKGLRRSVPELTTCLIL
jgi:hypothetical protein